MRGQRHEQTGGLTWNKSGNKKTLWISTETMCWKLKITENKAEISNSG